VATTFFYFFICLMFQNFSLYFFHKLSQLFYKSKRAVFIMQAGDVSEFLNCIFNIFNTDIAVPNIFKK